MTLFTGDDHAAVSRAVREAARKSGSGKEKKAGIIDFNGDAETAGTCCFLKNCGNWILKRRT